MIGFQATSYSVNDFRNWNTGGELTLNPKFQRRSVWPVNAKSYLIDTIIKGKPVPKIFIRQNIDLKTKRTIRDVVDGQQRLRAIIEFLEDGFRISKIHSGEYGGKLYSQLSEDVQTDILNYQLSVDILIGIDDADVLDIFKRLNARAYILNRPEKLNAEYSGDFKETVHLLAKDYYSFWENNKIFSDQSILRMKEVELVSELLIAMNEGMKNIKDIKKYYKDWDAQFAHREISIERFNKIITLISEIFGQNLAKSRFKRPQLFYSLFCSLYHLQYKLPLLEASQKKIVRNDLGKVRIAVNEIEKMIRVSQKDPAAVFSAQQRKFLVAASAATSEPKMREIKAQFICSKIVSYLSH